MDVRREFDAMAVPIALIMLTVVAMGLLWVSVRESDLAAAAAEEPILKDYPKAPPTEDPAAEDAPETPMVCPMASDAVPRRLPMG